MAYSCWLYTYNQLFQNQKQKNKGMRVVDKKSIIMRQESTVIVYGFFQLPHFCPIILKMHIRFSSDDPIFKQALEILQLKYRTTAAAKAIRRSVYDFAKMEVEIEILRAHNESMKCEIDRLRELLEVHRDTKLSTKWRYLR